MRPKPIEPMSGQRSVWDFPRPPAIERETRQLRVVHAGVEVVASNGCIKVLETSHPPTFYFPPTDVRSDLLRPRRGRSLCEWKGEATYFDVVVEHEGQSRVAEAAAFTYEQPSPRFADYAGWVSFYPGRVDACWVGDERVTPQPGRFYSGWITSDLAGPFKGVPGSHGW